MSKGFWETISKPFFCLAPMADVTDAAYRRVIAKYGKPDVLWTEFVSAEGLFKGGYDALINDLLYDESERPIVAQFFSKDPELMARAARLAEELGFDGVDINMGCPDKNVCKQGAGAAMIRTPELAQEIVRTTQKVTKLPVSIKTRIGYTTNEIETWLPALLEAEPAAVTLHARTKKEMSKVPAHWEVIARAVEIRNNLKSETLIVGNGDVADMADAQEKAGETGADGVMLGRAIFGNPWLFSNLARVRRECQIENPAPIVPAKGEEGTHIPVSLNGDTTQSRNSAERSECVATDTSCTIGARVPRPPLIERLSVLKEHMTLFDELAGDTKPFHLMKKHFKSYIKGEGSSKELIRALMATKSAEEAEALLVRFLT